MACSAIKARSLADARPPAPIIRIDQIYLHEIVNLITKTYRKLNSDGVYRVL